MTPHFPYERKYIHGVSTKTSYDIPVVRLNFPDLPQLQELKPVPFPNVAELREPAPESLDFL